MLVQNSNTFILRFRCDRLLAKNLTLIETGLRLYQDEGISGVEDFTQNDETYDVILDMVSGESAFARYRVSLRPNGLYLAGAGGLKAFAQMAWTSLTGGKKVIAGMAPDRRGDLAFLNELLESGKIKPVIDRCYTFQQTAEAHRYVDSGRKRGSVVITITADE